MSHDYWHKQTHDKPLYPDLLWSRPERTAQAGKLLIIGGNAHGFAAAGEAFSEAQKAGAGTVRVVLPDSLQKTVGKVFAAGEYAPSTPSGSFSQQALDEFLAMSQWADGVLLAGDFGRNSETAVLLEKFLSKFSGEVTLTKDAVDYFNNAAGALLDRPQTTLVLSFAQLQKLAIQAHFDQAFRFDMDFLRLLEMLHDFTKRFKISIITKHLETVFVAVDGEVSTTKLAPDIEVWRVRTAATASVWWLQNPEKTFAALCSSLI
jgi:hypothetical protein